MPQVSSSPQSSEWLSAAHLASFHAAQTDAHRVHSTPGCWIERFGRDYLISHSAPRQRDLALAELRAWCTAHSLPIDRVYGKALADTESDRLAPILLQGDATRPPQTIVTENGTRYGLDFAASYSAGLFIDQRANRDRWRQSPPKKLLNCFAYTCSFSVVAAGAGAETVSVDLSKKSLERGRANFALNQLDATTEAGRKHHRFIADDVFGVLPYLKKRGEKFDGIVLDPPTFARGTKAKTFRAERDFGALLDLALDLAAPGARLLLSTNCTKLQLRDLDIIARGTLKNRNLNGVLTPGPTLPDIPAAAMPTTVWVTLQS